MDDLLAEFLRETDASLAIIARELVWFARAPGNPQILGNVFRLMHTIRDACGFLGLSRMAMLAHAAETLLDCHRDGAPVTNEGVSMILMSIDTMKHILDGLARTGAEPEGGDDGLINALLILAKAAPKARVRADLRKVPMS